MILTRAEGQNKVRKIRHACYIDHRAGQVKTRSQIVSGALIMGNGGSWVLVVVVWGQDITV